MIGSKTPFKISQSFSEPSTPSDMSDSVSCVNPEISANNTMEVPSFFLSPLVIIVRMSGGKRELESIIKSADDLKKFASGSLKNAYSSPF